MNETIESANPLPETVAPHSDDLAVDRFAAAMKKKLARKREQGRGGWDDKDGCSNALISQLMRDHVEKGDPLDVGNLAMMLHQRGETIAHPDTGVGWQPSDTASHGKCGIPGAECTYGACTCRRP